MYSAEGDYRVLYTRDAAVQRIVVHFVRHRREIYRMPSEWSDADYQAKSVSTMNRQGGSPASSWRPACSPFNFVSDGLRDAADPYR